ncbi:hypothetical protein [Streptomyces sp.]|uniref:hypothetical protein n=1 Tax=Streptomyces sp. TaxID=1931 RepID=UPI002D770233|nr:hypothetical protein [Streptomyces sp.]HET6354692.1 hypothetical protein [Streptomyces sp.]
MNRTDELGLGDSMDDCGHLQGSADPNGEHRMHPRLFRITTNGRQVVADTTSRNWTAWLRSRVRTADIQQFEQQRAWALFDSALVVAGWLQRHGEVVRRA